MMYVPVDKAEPRVYTAGLDKQSLEPRWDENKF